MGESPAPLAPNRASGHGSVDKHCVADRLVLLRIGGRLLRGTGDWQAGHAGLRLTSKETQNGPNGLAHRLASSLSGNNTPHGGNHGPALKHHCTHLS